MRWLSSPSACFPASFPSTWPCLRLRRFLLSSDAPCSSIRLLHVRGRMSCDAPSPSHVSRQWLLVCCVTNNVGPTSKRQTTTTHGKCSCLVVPPNQIHGDESMHACMHWCINILGLVLCIVVRCNTSRHVCVADQTDQMLRQPWHQPLHQVGNIHWPPSFLHPCDLSFATFSTSIGNIHCDNPCTIHATFRSLRSEHPLATSSAPRQWKLLHFSIRNRSIHPCRTQVGSKRHLQACACGTNGRTKWDRCNSRGLSSPPHRRYNGLQKDGATTSKRGKVQEKRTKPWAKRMYHNNETDTDDNRFSRRLRVHNGPNRCGIGNGLAGSVVGSTTVWRWRIGGAQADFCAAKQSERRRWWC